LGITSAEWKPAVLLFFSVINGAPEIVMNMGMGGLETHMKVLDIHPKLSALIVGGFSESERIKRAWMPGAGAYLRKSYNFVNPGRAVKQELQRTG
jgi:DNA-binding NarL/FixJ family response regulator